jgi:hypothetical protein
VIRWAEPADEPALRALDLATWTSLGSYVDDLQLTLPL